MAATWRGKMLLRVAVHEAGHATMCLVENFDLYSVQVNKDTCSGFCSFDRGNPEYDELDKAALVRILLAGELAEHLIYGGLKLSEWYDLHSRHDNSGWVWRPQSDLGQVVSLLGRNPDAIKKEEEQALVSLKRHEKAIMRIATETIANKGFVPFNHPALRLP